MATDKKKLKVKWDNEAERKLIDIWATVLEENAGKMVTRKKKEQIATTRLNIYLTETFGTTTQYSDKAL